MDGTFNGELTRIRFFCHTCRQLYRSSRWAAKTAALGNDNVLYHVRRAKARFSRGCKSRPATFVPAGSNRSSCGGNETSDASGVEGHESDLVSMQAVTRVNAEQASKDVMWKPTRHD